MPARSQGDNIIEQRQELEKIKKELNNSQMALDSLRQVEKNVLKEISNYEQQASANKAVLNRLTNQLYSIRKEADRSKQNLEQSQEKYSAAHDRYASNLKYYYTGSRNNKMIYADRIEEEKNIFRKMVYLRALAAYYKQDLTQASQFLVQAEEDFDKVTSEEKKVGDAQKKKRSEYVILSSHKEKKERDLSKLRRKKEREADRVITLSEAARQMEDLIARLEKARMERERANLPTTFDFSTGNFVSYKGGLPAPIKGTITSGYGWKTDPVTNLKSFSPGIELSGRKKSSIEAIAPGVVAYVGTLRGYGKFLIIEHEDGYYSMYSGLENLIVEQNQIVQRGEKIGNTATGVIKFELRKGRESIDPIGWLRIDSFK
jgi:septal ring factor EnvC (AmiA/AmiB activator)